MPLTVYQKPRVLYIYPNVVKEPWTAQDLQGKVHTGVKMAHFRLGPASAVMCSFSSTNLRFWADLSRGSTIIEGFLTWPPIYRDTRVHILLYAGRSEGPVSKASNYHSTGSFPLICTCTINTVPPFSNFWPALHHAIAFRNIWTGRGRKEQEWKNQNIIIIEIWNLWRPMTYRGFFSLAVPARYRTRGRHPSFFPLSSGLNINP